MSESSQQKEPFPPGAPDGTGPDGPTALYDEILALNQRLSDVSRELHRTNAKLEGLNRELEERVAERTVALRETVERLEREAAERARTADALRDSEEMLAAQYALLEQKNAALREMLSQIEREKKRVSDDVVENVDRLLIPLVQRLKERATGIERGWLDVLEDNVRTLTTPFGRRLDGPGLGLTGRELELCNLLRSGLSSKEIATLLGVSEETISTHRRSIRRKFGLTQSGTNLVTYLKAL